MRPLNEFSAGHAEFEVLWEWDRYGVQVVGVEDWSSKTG